MRASKVILVISAIALIVFSQVNSVIASAEEEKVYALATVQFKESGSSSSVMYANIKLEIPKYIKVDQLVKINVYFERNGKCWSNAIAVFVISGLINTGDGERETKLSSVSFPACTDKASKTIEFAIPRELVDNSIDNKIKIFVSEAKMTNTSFIVITSQIIESIPAQVFIVTKLPKPTASIENLEIGYLKLDAGSTGSVSIKIKSLYGPISVTSVNVTAPRFVAVYLNTPLPLNIGANQEASIDLAVKALEPGAGIVTVEIAYYDGYEVKSLYVFFPVVASEDRIYDLINEYQETLREIEERIRELEEILGVSLENNYTIVNKLDAIAGAIEDIVDTLNDLRAKYFMLLDSINTINNRLESINNEITRINSNINRLSEELNRVNNSIERLSGELLQVKQKTLATEEDLAKLSADISNVEDKLNNIVEEVQILSTQLASLKEQVSLITSELNKVSSKASSYEDTINSLSERVQYIEDATRQLDESLSNVSERLRLITILIAVALISIVASVIARR